MRRSLLALVLMVALAATVWLLGAARVARGDTDAPDVPWVKVPARVNVIRDVIQFELKPQDGERCICTLTPKGFGCACIGVCGMSA